MEVFIMLDINKMRENQRLNNRNQTSVHLAYYLYSDDDFLTVLLPEKPTGKLKVRLKQNERRIDAGAYDAYELHALNIKFNDAGEVLCWSKAHLKDVCESTYFLAYLADGGILGKDCKSYKLYENRILNKEGGYSSHLAYMLSTPIDTVNNVKLWVKGNTIFGVEECEDHVYRESWDIEDCLFDYINSYDRYYAVKNVSLVKRSNDMESIKENTNTSDETDMNSNNSTVKMSIREFIHQCEACGGNGQAMILTGIKKVFPDDYEAVRNKYNSITFYEGKVKASEFLHNWITAHGVYSEEA